MNMLFIVRCDPYKSQSGTEIFAGYLALEIIKQGHKVKLIYEGKDYEKLITKSQDGIEAYGLNLIGIPYLRALHFIDKCANICIDLIKKSNIDIIISFGAGSFAGDIFTKISNSTKKPLFIYYAIDSMIAEYERSKVVIMKRGIISQIKAWIWYKVLIRSDKLSCKVADLITASCKDTANRIVKDYQIMPTKVNVVYFGLPDNYAKDLEPHDDVIPTLLHISTAPDRKGTFYFLKALRILQDNYNLRVRGIIAGTKELHYISLAKKLDIDVDFLGRIPNNILKTYYAACSILVSPSLSEGFCFPVIEASMFGKPSVVTNVGSLPELVTDGENGYIVPVADEYKLAQSLYRITIDTELRMKMGQNARRRSEDFTISRTATNLLESITKNLTEDM